jgi:hypothetical protein
MFTTLLTLIALFGPPWISIEYPANPLDPTTRGGYLLVHTFHHQAAVAAAVSGEAVTWDHGTRRATTLRFESTSRPGVYRLAKQWTEATPYVLVITVAEGDHGSATALVSVTAAGEVAKVEVPSEPYRDFRVPRAPREAEIAAAFRAAGGSA